MADQAEFSVIQINQNAAPKIKKQPIAQKKEVVEEDEN